MNLPVEAERLAAAYDAVRSELLSERTVGGHWVGELGSSPLATAAAVSALVIAHQEGATEMSAAEASSLSVQMQQVLQGDLSELIVESLHWLAQRQNDDGGWSDSPRGRSNVAATTLVQTAFRLTGVPAKYEGLTDRAEEFLELQGGAAAMRNRFGRDKSVMGPVLASAALAGLVPWRQVPALPFEWTCLPQRWHGRLKLPVASYAIPLLVAMGQLKFRHDPPRNPITRMARFAARKKSLAIVERMQPPSGGFCESVPLTAFVVIGLAGAGHAEHPIVARGVEFLLASVRSDGSWPLDANLATWNTALAVHALAEPQSADVAGRARERSRERETVAVHASWHDTLRTNGFDHRQRGEQRRATQPSSADHGPGLDSDSLDENCLDWLLECQRGGSPPGMVATPAGWSWTDLEGGLPETGATAATLVALANSRHTYPQLKLHRLQLAAWRGIEWLLERQRGDGGWSAFESDWHSHAVDSSACDLTAHALRALAVWRRVWSTEPLPATAGFPREALIERITAALDCGVQFLVNEQHNDGSFVPLWFGNQHHPEGHNLVVGTACVLAACAELGSLAGDMAQRAARLLLAVQHADGGWGPPRSLPATSLSNVYRSGRSRAEDALASFCSVEETAAAVEALLPLAESNQLCARAVRNGLIWLVDAVEQGRLRQPAPIGRYFPRLWYHERLYPLVFAARALGQAVRQYAPQRPIAAPVG